MPSESELLRFLDDEPRTPSTVDIARAIATGRRRRVRRRLGYAAAAGVTALAVTGASVAGGVFQQAPRDRSATGALEATASAAPPKPEYTIPGTPGWNVPAAKPPSGCTLHRLPVPDNAPMALVTGADPAGRYLVGRTYPRRGGYQAVIWQDGGVRKVTLPGDVEESLADVNSTGTAVGWSYTDGEDAGPVPYVYQNGRLSKLPGVRHGNAYAINDAGAIVGADDSRHAALVWPSATAQPIRLPLPAGATAATAHDIDEDGTTVGTVDDKRPYVWFPDGTHRELPMPDLDGRPATNAQVFSVRNGWATGIAGDDDRHRGDDPRAISSAGSVGNDQPAPDRTGAVRWNVRTGEVRVFDRFEIRASTANAHGWQIGTDAQGRAVLVTDAGTVVLPDLYSHQPNSLSNIPTTLSDDGRVIGGQSDDSTGTIQAVVWRCQ